MSGTPSHPTQGPRAVLNLELASTGHQLAQVPCTRRNAHGCQLKQQVCAHPRPWVLGAGTGQDTAY